MEEALALNIQGQIITITQVHLQKLLPLVTLEQLSSLRLPFVNFNADLDVLTSCMYYLLIVQQSHNQRLKNVFINDNMQVSFRERLMQPISHHYVSRSMNFELYQYAYICSKLMSIPLQKCIHIIYYLVYSRLASKPYVSQLIKENQLRRTTAVKAQKLAKDSVHRSKSGQRRQKDTLKTIKMIAQPQDQTTKFYKELRQVLAPQTQLKKVTKKTDKKYQFKKSKEDAIQKTEEQKIQTGDNIVDPSGVTKIPNRVGSHQISWALRSVLGTNGHRKTQSMGCGLRRQKFKEQYDVNERYMRLFQQQDQGQIFQGKISWQKQSRYNQNRLHKKAFQYFKDISNNIKQSNCKFDAIRQQSMPRSRDSTARNSKEMSRHSSKHVKKQQRLCNTAGGLLYNRVWQQRRDKNAFRTQEVSPLKQEPVFEEVQIQLGHLNSGSKQIQQAEKQRCLGSMVRQRQGYQQQCFSFGKHKLTTTAKLHKHKLDFKQFLNRQIQARAYRLA